MVFCAVSGKICSNTFHVFVFPFMEFYLFLEMSISFLFTPHTFYVIHQNFIFSPENFAFISPKTSPIQG